MCHIWQERSQFFWCFFLSYFAIVHNLISGLFALIEMYLLCSRKRISSFRIRNVTIYSHTKFQMTWHTNTKQCELPHWIWVDALFFFCNPQIFTRWAFARHRTFSMLRSFFLFVLMLCLWLSFFRSILQMSIPHPFQILKMNQLAKSQWILNR